MKRWILHRVPGLELRRWTLRAEHAVTRIIQCHSDGSQETDHTHELAGKDRTRKDDPFLFLLMMPSSVHRLHHSSLVRLLLGCLERVDQVGRRSRRDTDRTDAEGEGECETHSVKTNVGLTNEQEPRSRSTPGSRGGTQEDA